MATVLKLMLACLICIGVVLVIVYADEVAAVRLRSAFRREVDIYEEKHGND